MQKYIKCLRPNEYNTRLSNMFNSSKPNDFSFQTIRLVGGGLSMEWTTGGAPRCFNKLRFQETTQKGLSEPAISSVAPLVVSSEAARTTKYYESGGHVWTGLNV